jgi:hypothetical protein
MMVGEQQQLPERPPHDQSMPNMRTVKFENDQSQ